MSNQRNHQGKVAIIGGGSKGLGKGCALALASGGCDIVIAARGKKALQNTADELETKGVRVLAIQADMSKSEDNNMLVKKTLEKFKKINILINNSGGPPPGNFKEFRESDWVKSFQSVLMYNIRMVNLTLPEMVKKKWGRIINLTSLSAKEPAEMMVLSNVFRVGVISFAKTISKELIKSGITINNICPGAFKTDRAVDLIRRAAKDKGKTADEVECENVAKYPLGRYQTPDELGALVDYLCSELAGGITGTTISVDGGISNCLF